MALINGNDLILTLSDSESGTKIPFAHSNSLSYSISNSLVEATLGVTGGWAEYVSGKRTTSINFEGLQDYGTITDAYGSIDLGDFLVDAKYLYFQVGQGDNVEIGEGYISEITLESSVDDVARYSGTLTITKDLGLESEIVEEFLQDSEGNNILGDDGQPLKARVRK